MDYLFHIVPAVAVGLQITLKIFIITIILSLPLGILMAIGRISKIAILRKAMYAYITSCAARRSCCRSCSSTMACLSSSTA